MMTNTMTCPDAMPAAPAPPRAALKPVNLLSTSFRCHYCRTNENPHDLLRFLLYGAIVSVYANRNCGSISYMSLNDNGAAYYRVLDLLKASCRGLFQPGCPWLDRRYLHETSKDVFCVAPPVDVRRFLQVPYHPVRLSISPRADFVDRVAVETVSLLHSTKRRCPQPSIANDL